ncbi:hypothetical protein TEA_013725 [Camellia sinensis var. sinensis]|uniref:Uncharacterized protein n=1 Tax=Camellia sinensis var. sinensis TaxID=542762 RepID=A0A4S4DKV5_CAMSN|nr:hypothetical protein TEA_013725 [Camellia sinensis var. sinensis]
MDSKQPSILILPWLAHGHVSPFLELAKKLSQRNFNIYFCSTPINLKPLRETLPLNLSSSIQLIDIHLPSQNLPPHYTHQKTSLPTSWPPSKLLSMTQTRLLHHPQDPQTKPHYLRFPTTLGPNCSSQRKHRGCCFPDMQRSVLSFSTHCSDDPNKDYPFQNSISQQFNARKLFSFMYDTSNGLTNRERIFKKLGSLQHGELDCLVVDEDSGAVAVCEGRLAADLEFWVCSGEVVKKSGVEVTKMEFVRNYCSSNKKKIKIKKNNLWQRSEDMCRGPAGGQGEAAARR